MLVNEADYLGAGRRAERKVAIWFGCLKDVFPAHTGSEVSCGVGGVVQWPCLMCVRLWTCGCCVLIVGWVAVFRWPGHT